MAASQVSLIRKLGKYPFHTIAIILFFITHGYSENVGLIPIIDLLVFFVIVTLIAFALLFFFRKQTGSLVKAGLITTTLFFFYLFFGAISDGFKNYHLLYFLSRYRALLPGMLLLIIGLFFYLKKSRKSFLRITACLNFILLVLITVDFVSIAAYPAKEKTNAKLEKNEFNEPLQLCDSCKKPDIYFIIMDEYWGTDMLTRYYGYDNHAFISFLSDNGFHVLKHPSSNYSATPLSILSIFNMEYIEWMKKGRDLKVSDYAMADKAIGDATTIRFLKSMGYEIKNYSIFDMPGQPSTLDQGILPVKMKLITSKTLLRRMQKDLLWHIKLKIAPKFNWLARLFQNQFKKLNEKVISLTNETIDSPSSRQRFVYSHLLMPHLPAIYDSAGKEIFINFYQSDHSPKTVDDTYLQYLIYTNKVIQSLTEKIIKKTNGKAVIILMSDHGYRSSAADIGSETTASGNSISANNNFNAVFFPSKNYALLYDSMSNVNQFRVVFNSLFQQQLPILKDSVIF